MDIHYGIETGSLGIARNLCHPVKPGSFNRIVRSIPDMSHPGHRYTDSRESLGLDIVKRGLGAFRIAPESLAGDSANYGIHLVAEVPAISELP